MTVSDDVIRDLLPLYASGEASDATRQLVDEWLARDAVLARELATLQDDELVKEPDVRPVTEGRAVINRTRRLIRRRTGFLAAAAFFTLLPFSVAGDSDGVHFFLIRDLPTVGYALVLVAGALWIGFLMTARRLRVAGL